MVSVGILANLAYSGMPSIGVASNRRGYAVPTALSKPSGYYGDNYLPKVLPSRSIALARNCAASGGTEKHRRAK